MYIQAERIATVSNKDVADKYKENIQVKRTTTGKYNAANKYI